MRRVPLAVLIALLIPCGALAGPVNQGSIICNAPGYQGGPRACPDGAGGAIVTWQDQRDGDSDIYVQHLLASGAMDPLFPANGRAVTTNAISQYSPMIVADGAGGAIVTWYETRNGSSDIYAQHLLASGVVDPAWPPDGRALCTAANEQSDLAIVTDGLGGAIITWQDYRGGDGSDCDIYAQHILASGQVDPAWPIDGRALCTAFSSQFSPRIVPDDILPGAVCS